MTSENPMLSGLNAPYPRDREPVKLILMSSEAGVREAIHQLHNLRFREANSVLGSYQESALHNTPLLGR